MDVFGVLHACCLLLMCFMLFCDLLLIVLFDFCIFLV